MECRATIGVSDINCPKRRNFPKYHGSTFYLWVLLYFGGLYTTLITPIINYEFSLFTLFIYLRT